MQLSLVQFGAIAAGGLVALGRLKDSMPGSEEEELKPIEINLSEVRRREGSQGLLHSTAEFLIISISGCAPKQVII